MPQEQYDAAVAMLTATDNDCFDQTPAARRKTEPKENVHKSRYSINGYAIHKCMQRLAIAEGYKTDSKGIDNYKLNSPSRILCEIYWCQQREDWKHMAELILAAIHKLSMFTYLVVLIQVQRRNLNKILYLNFVFFLVHSMD